MAKQDEKEGTRQRFRKAKLDIRGVDKPLLIYHSLHRSGYTLKEVATEWLEQGSEPTEESLINFIENLNIPGVFAMNKSTYRALLARRRKQKRNGTFEV